jgi:GrpB-like predicted nucleotidyltransferase (UPF0157 family)/ribosomal protein S18 acetylase RimI-like enzyme
MSVRRAGVRNGRVELVAYDPAWPALYETERQRLEPLLPGALEIHHIGSTAVPGLLAKPIIDIVALVDDLDAPIAALIDNGYQYARAFNATLSHRRFLCYPTASHRTHHLHLVDDCLELERRLCFRDRLRADPALAEEYVALKRALAARYPEDRESYTEAKAPFIKRVERQAGLDVSVAGSASEFAFCAAGPQDAEQLGRAVAEGFQSYLPFAPAGWTPRSAEDETELLHALLERDDFWCLLAWAERAPAQWADVERAPAERVLAGHVAFLPASRAWRDVEDPDLGHLRQLFLAPDFWGAGLAHTLHTRALRAARECGFTAMRLFTPTGQARARRFYEREGWTVGGEPFCDPGFGLQLVEYRRSLR